MIPTIDEIDKFRETLRLDGVEITKKKLRQTVYGAHDNWKCQEAEAYIREQETAVDEKIKKESLEQVKQANLLQENANKISEQANRIAKYALGLSVLALIISILVAILK